MNGLPNLFQQLLATILTVAGAQVIPPPSGTANGFLFTARSTVPAGADWEAGSGGTVTSVALTVPTDETVTGSPIVGAGTLAITRNNQTAQTVLAGPASGAAAAPTYRLLVPADTPALATFVAGNFY